MKIVLVLSQITYIPQNCYPLLKSVLTQHSKEISGIILLQNLGTAALLGPIWLYLTGCAQLAKTLGTNIVESFVKHREKLAQSHRIPVLTVKNMNEPWVVKWIKKNNIDCIINVRTRCIYKKNILAAPKFGCFNLHHGLLPTYRGMYCDLYALFANRPAGITLHKMNTKIDDGNIIYLQKVSSGHETDYCNYLGRLYLYESNLINKLINHLTRYHRSPTGQIQKPKNITYTQTPNFHMLKQMQKSGLKL